MFLRRVPLHSLYPRCLERASDFLHDVIETIVIFEKKNFQGGRLREKSQLRVGLHLRGSQKNKFKGMGLFQKGRGFFRGGWNLQRNYA